MTSGNVTNIGPSAMVVGQVSAKDGDKSSGFLDVMNKNVEKKDMKLDTQNLASSSNVKDDNKAKVDNTKATASNDKKTVNSQTNKADRKADNHFSNEKKVNNEDVAKEAVSDVEGKDISPDEIPTEVVTVINEALEGFSAEVAKVLEEALNISEDELESAMSTLNITYADLLNPKEVTSLMVEVADVEDSVSLVLNEDLSDALSTVRDLGAQVLEETGVDAETIIDVVNANDTVSFKEELGNVIKETAPQLDDNILKDMQSSESNENQVEFDKNVVSNNKINSNIQPALDEVVLEAEPEVEIEAAPTVVNKDLNVTKDEDAKVSTDNTEDVSGNVVAKEELNAKGTNNSDNSGNMTRGEHDNRAFTANVAADVQNVQPQAPEIAEERPVLSRFDTIQMINQISEQARVNITREVTSLEMILNPESLGKIYLNVSQEKGAMKAHIAAQNEIVKEALEQQMVALKDNLNKAGLKVEAVEVSVGTHEFERNLEEGMHQQEEQSRQQQEQKSQMGRNSINLNNMDELQGLMSEEDKLVAQMMKDQGNSVNYMA